MKIYIIVGELSGEKHASQLIRALKSEDQDIQIRGCGGTLMKEAGCEIAFDYSEYAIMGFTKVIANLGKIKKYLKDVEQDIRQFSPNKVIMIDYPGFNLRLAKKIHSIFPLYYYIPPKAWAWNKKRVHQLKKYCQKVYSILPFEIEFFKNYEIPIEYVGNPSFHEVNNFLKQQKEISKEYIALIPGSRVQEIKRMLPVMIEAANKIGKPYYVSKSPNLSINLYAEFVSDLSILKENMYELLHQAEFAFVTSGTATLETALFDVPQVVCYKTDPFSYWIAKNLVSIKYISLVNLINNQPTITELIQDQCVVSTIVAEYNNLQDASKRSKLQKEYRQMIHRLGVSNPSLHIAKDII